MKESKISAFVITADQRPPYILEACLQRARFADELILVDKSQHGLKKDLILAKKADRYVCAPWSPVVEDTRAFAQAQCTGDWIICLDDDEILSPRAGDHVRSWLSSTDADVYYIPIKHYILGSFVPQVGGGEIRPCLYRKGFVEYPSVVHVGAKIRDGARIRKMGDVWIEHLSHPDVAAWIEKTNRYTSVPNRSGQEIPQSLGRWAREIIDRRLGSAGVYDYPQAVALLRAIYDIVDGLKRWEETQPNGEEAFRKICKEIVKE